MKSNTEKTIDLGPTWKTAAVIYVECLLHGDSESAKQGARDDILRMAELLDGFVNGVAAKNAAIVEAVDNLIAYDEGADITDGASDDEK